MSTGMLAQSRTYHGSLLLWSVHPGCVTSCSQARAAHARASMEPLEASRADKQRQLASILDSISSSRSRRDESTSRMDLLKAQA